MILGCPVCALGDTQRDATPGFLLAALPLLIGFVAALWIRRELKR
jgi:hypothetical protein